MEERANVRLRWALMERIAHEIRRRGLRQVDAAELFGTTQPRISDVVRGKVDELSLDSLVNMISAAGLPLGLVGGRERRDLDDGPEPVVQAYADGVDRTLIRESLRRSPTDRVRALSALQRLAEEAQRGRRAPPSRP